MTKKPNQKSVEALIRKVQGSLTDELRKPKYRGHPNPMAGHCYVATEALSYLLGGKGAGWRQKHVSHENDSHWFLKHDSGIIVDATASQFRTPVPYEKGLGIGFQGKPGVPSGRAAEVIRRVRNAAKPNPVWKDFVRGEYWIHSGGDIEGADLDVGDKGHEAIAIDRMLDADKLIGGLIKYYESMNEEYKENYGVEDQISTLHSYREMDMESSEINALEYIPDEAGIAAAGNKDKWEAVERDARVAYARYEGGIQVTDTNFYAWKVTRDVLSRIVDFLAEMLGGEDELIAAKREIVWIEEGSTGRTASATVGRILEIKNPRDLWASRHVPRRSNPTRTYLHAWILKDGTIVDVGPFGHAKHAARILGVAPDDGFGGFKEDTTSSLYFSMLMDGAIKISISMWGTFQTYRFDKSSLKRIQDVLLQSKDLIKGKDEVTIERTSPHGWVETTVDDLLAASSPRDLPTGPRRNPVRSNPTLSPKDKKVVDAFVDRQPKGGNVLNTDGETLISTGFGGGLVARWLNGEVVVTLDPSTKLEASIFRYLHKIQNAGTVKSRTTFVFSDVPNKPIRSDEVSGGTVTAKVDGEESGKLIWYKKKLDSKYFIDSIHVKEKWRRKGVGTAIYQEWMRRLGLRLLDLAPTGKTAMGAKFRRAIDERLPNPVHLTPKDKKVIDAFVGRKKLSGKVLESDGRTLSRSPGSEDVANWMGDRIVEVSTESTRLDQTILRYMNRRAKADRVAVVSGYGRPIYSKGLHFFVTGESLYPGQWDGLIMAYVPGRANPVGYLNFSLYEGRASIQMVEVASEFKRFGVATALHRHLLKSQGLKASDLDPGMQTDEGFSFRKAMDPYFREQ